VVGGEATEDGSAARADRSSPRSRPAHTLDLSKQERRFVVSGVREYLGCVVGSRPQVARDRLSELIEREGLGEVNGAMADTALALLDRVRFAPGAIVVQDAIEASAKRVVELVGVPDAAVPRLASLIVYLGSSDLASAARADVASWTPLDRLDMLVTLSAGLAATVAEQDSAPLAHVVKTATGVAHLLATGAAHIERAQGSFGLTRRDPSKPSLLDGSSLTYDDVTVVFNAEEPCSLPGIFRRVAALKDGPLPALALLQSGVPRAPDRERPSGHAHASST
jgi:hypothetical protein